MSLPGIFLRRAEIDLSRADTGIGSSCSTISGFDGEISDESAEIKAFIT